MPGSQALLISTDHAKQRTRLLETRTQKERLDETDLQLQMNSPHAGVCEAVCPAHANTRHQSCHQMCTIKSQAAAVHHEHNRSARRLVERGFGIVQEPTASDSTISPLLF